jgi:hypothetical protein
MPCRKILQNIRESIFYASTAPRLQRKGTRGPEKGPIKTDTLQQAMQAKISCHSSIPSRFEKIDTTKAIKKYRIHCLSMV